MADVEDGKQSGSALQRVTDGRLRWLHVHRTERPAGAVAVLLALAWGASLFAGGAAAWGVSGAALAEGRHYTLLSHMFSHAGLGHLFLNVLALAALSPRLVRGLGTDRKGWLRYAAALVLSGLCGAALYLLFHPTGAVPMVGASGAIFGVWGAAARLPPDGGDILPIRSRQVALEVRSAVIANLILIVPIALLDLAIDITGGLAWEAHLGGFLFGLLAAPYLVRPTSC